MRLFSKLRCVFSPTSVSNAATCSPSGSLVALESTARGMADYIKQCAALAQKRSWISSGETEENYRSKLVRLASRRGSLLMRVDSRNLHDTTYVFGKTLWKMRVQTLNPLRIWSGWTN